MGVTTKVMDRSAGAVSVRSALTFFVNLAPIDKCFDDLKAAFLDAAFWKGIHATYFGRRLSAVAWLLSKC